MDDMPARVAVLEQIARNTEAMLAEIRTDMREFRKDLRSDFRWLLATYGGGFIILLGVMAHGFHWV